MKREILIAGFGGQGLLFAGRVLAYAAMDQGFEVTWLPSYGPQMRGGTANCTVVISDTPIRSPIVRRPTGLIVLNRPSLDEFGPRVREGGVVVVESAVGPVQPLGSNVLVLEVPATETADRLGNVQVANLVALGGYVGATGAVLESAVEQALHEVLSESEPQLVQLNMAAFREGLKMGKRAAA